MTCIEKLRELHPEWDDEMIEIRIGEDCPMFHYIAPEPAFCNKTCDCKRCWEREIPVSENENLYDLEEKLTGRTMRRLRRLHDRIAGKDPGEIIDEALQYYEFMVSLAEKIDVRGVTGLYE